MKKDVKMDVDGNLYLVILSRKCIID